MEILYFDDQGLEEVDKELLSSLTLFVKSVWDDTVDTEKYLNRRRADMASNPYCEEGGLPLALLVEDGRVVGHCTSIPCKMWAHDKETLMFWNAGLHLLDECRGRGLGSLLPQKLIETLPVVTGFFVVPQQLRTHEKLGCTIAGKLPEYIKLLNARQFFKKISFNDAPQMSSALQKIMMPTNHLLGGAGAFVFSALYQLYAAFLKATRLYRGGRSGRIVLVDDFDDRVDHLWDRVKHTIRFAQIRNSKYINWQFSKERGWIKVLYEVDGIVLAYALCAKNENEKDGRLGGVRMFNIVDLLWDSNHPGALDHMLELIEELARKENADVMVCSVNHKRTQQNLLKRAFLRIPGTVYFTFHSNLEDLNLSPRMNDWFITRGDADAAGALGPG